MLYIYLCYLLIAILNFVVRRIFVDVLTVNYLGYDGLFTSIFSYLSISEMGIASIITYHMYSEIATDNVFKIRKLLYIYKLIYRLIGAFVLVSGLAVSLFLPIILRNKNTQLAESYGFIYAIYFLQLAATLCTYFFAYRRILFVTHQRIYVCTVVDTAVNMICVILKMLVLLKLKNYILYLLISILNNMVSNLIITVLSKKEYPEITSISVNKEDMKELNLGHEVKNMLVTKIATTVYGASDNIIFTKIFGLGMTGLIDNYKMLTSKINELILSLFNSLQASIGNLVYDEKSGKEKGVGFFKALDLAGFFMALVSTTALITIGQQFIQIWLKRSDLLLPYSFLIALSLNVFIAISNNPIVYFRNSLGHFEADRNYMVTAAIVNVVLSIVLGIFMGITGVMIGTVLGHIIIYVGRTIVVYRYYINSKPYTQYLTFAIRIVLLGLSSVSSVFIAAMIKNRLGAGVVSLLINAVISVVISCLVFVLSCFKTEEGKTLIHYVQAVIRTVLRRNEKAV